MTKQSYTSSMIQKYGDPDNIKADVKALNEILSRQGSDLLIDVIAESVGQTVNKFKLSSVESQRILTSLTESLKNAILERI